MDGNPKRTSLELESLGKLIGHYQFNQNLMQSLIAQDLRVGRKKTGLVQRDVSVLLNISTKEVAGLESGEREPSLLQLCQLSVLYNRSFTEYYEQLLREARESLFRNLPDLPESNVEGIQRHNRQSTIARLERSLTAVLTKRHDGT